MLKVTQHIRNVTEGSEWTRYLVLDTLEDSCLATTLLQKTKPHTFLLRFHFMFTRNEHFPAERGRAPFHASQLRSATQVSVTHRFDNTARLSHGKGHKTSARHARCTHRHC
jgi:hypothetical protein